MADTLATPAELASALQEDVDTATATLALELATGAVQAVTGQRLLRVVADQVTIDLDSDECGPYLYLPEWPVTAVTSATVGATAVTDYTAQLSRGRLWRALGWRVAALPDYRAPSTATIVYTHGYATGDQGLQFARAAVLELAKSAYAAAGGTGSVVREQIDDYAVQYAAMATSIESALDPNQPLARVLRRRYSPPRRSALLVRS